MFAQPGQYGMYMQYGHVATSIAYYLYMASWPAIDIICYRYKLYVGFRELARLRMYV